MLNPIIKSIAYFAAFAGIMMIAGSANDCDGACMEQANTLGEMISISLIGLFLIISGVYTAYKLD